MDKQPNKTYKAPDGSVFRLEGDGSLTKLGSGDRFTKEPPSEYQITSDGKIYRIESDGSITFLGYAEERQSPPPISSIPPNNGSNNRTRKVLIGMLIAELAVIIYFTLAIWFW